MNSATSDFQATPGVAPKEMVNVQHLRLNDGNEIPMVIGLFSFYSRRTAFN